MQIQLLLPALGCGALLVASCVGATDIFKCVGGDGQLYYSDADVDYRACEQVMLPPPPQSADAVPDYRAALEVAREIEASRLRREQARREQQKLLIERMRVTTQAAGDDSDATGYYIGRPWYQRWYRYPHRFPRGAKSGPGGRWEAEPWKSRRTRPSARVPGMGKGP